MRGRFVPAIIFGLVSSSAFGAPVTFGAAGADPSIQGVLPQGAVTLTPTATLTSIPSASASPTVLTTIVGGGGSPPPGTVPTLSAGMLTLLALGLATVAVLLIRRQ
jgi:hypothetical protein